SPGWCVLKWSFCGGVVCPSGTDCISINGTERCADPCEHYSIINDEWRSVNYTRSGPYHDDYDVPREGWYRMFLGESNARIPDWCVSRFSCGTLNSFWMAQPNPTEYGRIFKSDVYCMYPSNCYDERSYDMHVKLCYGNYYVYKLQPPKLGPSAYCAGNEWSNIQPEAGRWPSKVLC
uniref:UMOD/GP2/OIT3-like D8C domain-containing protein n=1 Tax=Acanthochromis polyacanthus TaxID=80966 RepID=A0A3Q1EVG7_9TELE